MKGIAFGNLHTYRDLNMILTHKTIGTPTPKTDMLDIPGGDGMLDMTEFFGEVKYGNRPITYEFSTAIPYEQFPAFFSRVQNALHGQKVPIVDDEDPDCYYIGRLTVSEFQAKRAIGTLTINCDCEPFRYHLAAQTVYLCGRNLINLDAGETNNVGTWTKTATGYTFTRGTATAVSYLYFTIPVIKGQKYAFSASYSSTGSVLYVYKKQVYGDLVAKAGKGSPALFTADENGLYICCMIMDRQTTGGTFENIMLEDAGSVGTYEAYDATERTAESIFVNVRKPAVPTAYVSGTVSVETASNYQALTPGSNTLDSFIFYQGNNTLTFKGSGSVVVEWLERGL